MLTVPATIQTLFKTDGIRKNFRVHFPNGENADLTNSDIIQESVRFTESVCSKEVFQFGLSERSQIEFECVNVQNIYGMVIECGIEIDTSSLSAAQISAIQANPGNGVLVLESGSDIGFGYYRIPYGVFIVEKCPRSHGAMWRRSVTAYGKQMSKFPTGFLADRLMVYLKDIDTITQNAYLLLASQENDISALSMSETTLSLTNNVINSHIYVKKNGNGYYLHIKGNQRHTATDAGQFNPIAMHRATCATFSRTCYDALVAGLVADGYTLDASSQLQLKRCFFPHVRYSAGSVTYTDNDTVFFNDPTDSGYVYDYLGVLPGSANTSRYYYPYQITDAYVTADGAGTGVHYADYGTGSNITTSPVVKLYLLTDTGQANMMMTLKGTEQRTIYNGSYYTFFLSVNLQTLKDAMLELAGKFGKMGRDGVFKEITLDASSPESIATSEYAELWWDDYTIDQVGDIVVKYNDVDYGMQQTVEYEFGTGNSRYEMADNYLLLNFIQSAADLGMPVSEYIYDVLEDAFIPATTQITYTPTDATLIGLPYLEAGDCIEIDDGNGGTVLTYMLRREISGVQTLFDTVESSGGEIIQGV